jgi:hypothetical protein
LLPPLDSTGRLAPPKVKDVCDACELDDSLATASAGGSRTGVVSFGALAGEISTAGKLGTSRAGAGALAAPLLYEAATAADDGWNPDVMSMEAAWLPRTGRGAVGAADAAACSMTLSSGKVSFVALGGVLGTELATAVLAAGAIGLAGDAAGRAGTAAVEAATAGLAGAAGLEGAAAVEFATGIPGFAGSPLRSSPRATRNVPFDCSILMGLVRTRLAPMRNAFATPA